MKTHLSNLTFFKFIRKSDIISLVNYYKNNQDDIHSDYLNEAQFLYGYFKNYLGTDFNVILVLEYVYLYCPKRFQNAPVLRLRICISELNNIVDKHKGVYNVKSIGEHKVFSVLNKVENFKLLATREMVWCEAVVMQNFLDHYCFWPPSWTKQRALFHVIFKAKDITIAVSRVGLKVTVVEAQGINGVLITKNEINDIQSIIDKAIKNQRLLQLEIH